MDKEVKIEAVLDAREREGEVQFKVQWIDSERRSSWELETNLKSPHNAKVINNYKHAHRRKMVNIEKKVDAVRSAECDESSDAGSDDGELRPRTLDLEEIVEGLNEATARARKKLHDDTHIYTPTEQLLLKSDSSGRLTRSQMRGKLEEMSPSISSNKQNTFPLNSYLMMEQPLDTDSDDEMLAEILEKSKLEYEHTPTAVYSCETEGDRGSRRPRGRPRGSKSKTKRSSTSSGEKPAQSSSGTVGGLRKRGRPRKLVFSDTKDSSKEDPCEMEKTVFSNFSAKFDDSMKLLSHVEPAQKSEATVNTQFQDICENLSPFKLSPSPSVDLSTECAQHSPKPLKPSDGTKANQLDLGDSTSPVRRKQSKELTFESASDSPNVKRSDLTSNTFATAGNSSTNLQCTPAKCFPHLSVASASSSIDDIAEMVISNQQEIENFRAKKREDNTSTRQLHKRSRTPSSSKKSYSMGGKENIVDMGLDENQEIIKRKTRTRRRMLDALPGPVSMKHLSEMRHEMHEEVTAKFIPSYANFDANKLLEAVQAGSLKQFREATVHFCAPYATYDCFDEICSVISGWRDENGGTLIHMVCRKIKCNETHEGDDLIFLLAKYSPELLRIRDKSLQIPLHIAVQKGEICRASKLLQLGSPITWHDSHSFSPVDIAYGKGGLGMLKLLLNAGATFHELLALEERLPPTSRRFLYSTLLKHCGILNGLLRGARRKILRNIRETVVLSPIFIAPVRDGLHPVFRFSYTPTPQYAIDCMQAPMLFTYFAINRPVQGRRGVEWSFRCHGRISCFAPKLNGRLLEPMTGSVPTGVPTPYLLENTFVYFCPLQHGTNVITFQLDKSYESTPLIFAAQVVMLRKNNPNPYSRGDVIPS
ncbi:hypothetical protein RB195_015519 [Necator americanus]|uniref:Chromo domain-containing protein n=1 Tax=Necator americanus TaxID=51031 RepID=A0ABR1E4Y5_NECAM